MHLGFDLRYYILLLRRRLIYILIPFVVVFAACIAVSMILTPTYRATGTILVESQQIPDELVRSTIVNLAGERIGIIKQRVMRRENLLRIAEKFELFPQEDLEGNAAPAIEALNRSVTVEPVKDDIGGIGRAGGSTMAFSVSFDHADPDVAHAVASELVSLFLQENVRNRTTRAAETTAFLTQESRKLKKQVDEIEARIARYKEQHRGALPDVQDVTLSRLEQTRTTLQRAQQEIETAQSERRLLTIQLSAAKSGMSLANGPYATQNGRLTPLQELEQLQTELLEKSAIYDGSHPDIGTLKRKISRLKSQYGIETGHSELARRLSDLRTELKQAQGRYAQDHPDIRRLQSEIRLVEKKMATAPKGGGSSPDNGGVVDPIYAHVEAQIDAADNRVAWLREQEKTLKDRIAELEATIAEAPMVERGLNALNRDYSTAVRKYEEIKAKEMEAQLAQSLEEDKQAERLTLLDAPVRPEDPIKPNRLKILAFGLAMALAAGGGGFLFAEAMDSSIRGATGYRAMLKSSPYVVIPYIKTVDEIRRRQIFLTGSLAGLAVLAVVGMVVFHLYIKPLDELVVGIIGRLA